MPWLSQGEAVVGRSWLVMGYMVQVPFLLALAVGMDVGQIRMGHGNSGIPSFLAARAISTPAMVLAKLLMLARGVLWVWGVILLGAFAWAVGMGRVGEMTDRLVTLTGSGTAAVGTLAAGVVLLMTITWLLLVEGMWVGLMGRTLLPILAIVLGVAFCVGLGVLEPWREDRRPLLGWRVAVLLTGQAAALAWVVYQLRRKKLMGTGPLAGAIAAWGLLIAIVVGLTVSFTAAGGAPGGGGRDDAAAGKLSGGAVARCTTGRDRPPGRTAPPSVSHPGCTVASPHDVTRRSAWRCSWSIAARRRNNDRQWK